VKAAKANLKSGVMAAKASINGGVCENEHRHRRRGGGIAGESLKAAWRRQRGGGS